MRTSSVVKGDLSTQASPRFEADCEGREAEVVKLRGLLALFRNCIVHSQPPTICADAAFVVAQSVTRGKVCKLAILMVLEKFRRSGLAQHLPERNDAAADVGHVRKLSCWRPAGSLVVEHPEKQAPAPKADRPHIGATGAFLRHKRPRNSPSILSFPNRWFSPGVLHGLPSTPALFRPRHSIDAECAS